VTNLIILAVLLVTVTSFLYEPFNDWRARRTRKLRNERSRAQHVLNKHRGDFAASEAEIRSRLDTDKLSTNERRYFEGVLRELRGGSVTYTAGEVALKPHQENTDGSPA
jgi:hypothetical protein